MKSTLLCDTQFPLAANILPSFTSIADAKNTRGELRIFRNLVILMIKLLFGFQRG